MCEFDSFFNNNLNPYGVYKGCIKCDNQNAEGQEGCNSTFGCSYNNVDNHLYCQQCKVGYFNYDWQCLSCSTRDGNCIKCHFDTTEDRFKCDKCKEKFYVNKETYLCDIITYDEYTGVTTGCILPINNHTLYEQNEKCFLCKDGFFKTKDESCIYCKARKNGGPKCNECQYIIDANGIETNNINCKNCSSGDMLSPSGKCFNCIDEVGPGCARCIFEEGTEEVICEECEEDYEPNSEGYCTSKYSYGKKVENCLDYFFIKTNRRLAFERSCIKCNDGYYAVKGECESLSIEICSLNSMFSSILCMHK